MSCSLLIIIFAVFLEGQAQFSDITKQCVQPCTCWHPTIDGNTLSVDCSQKELSHILQEWPQNIIHLVVSYAHNSLVHLKMLPPSNAQTVAISFKNCSIVSLDTALFLVTSQIEFLDLSWNLLRSEDIHADIFRGEYKNEEYAPIELKELNLAYNQIESLERKIFEHTPHLTSLDLSGNPLKVLDDSTWFALASLLQLRSLNISNTSLSKFPDQQVLEFRPPAIIQLDLSNNQLTQIPPSLATLSATLEILNINNNPIEELNDESFIGLSKLRELQINNMLKLRSIKHNTFSQLKHLRTLHLSHNPALAYIHDGAFGQIQNRPPIVELYINDNNLRELSPSLLNWSSVASTRLQGNHWACPCETSPPCICQEQKISGRSLDEEEAFEEASSFSISKTIFILVLIGLVVVAGVVCWRVLVKYRNYRVVNTMYPVMYSVPMASP